MALFIASLNSGSNGNCYYIGNRREAVLVDAGLSCKETERRMDACGLSMDLVKAIFVSHEHTDHIKGLERLSRKYDLPVYITAPTLVNSRLQLDPRHVRNFGTQQAVYIGDLEIKAFLKTHDAADPHSFLVSGHGVHIGVFTDLGYVCEGLSSHFALCHAAFLEANYDRYMLDHGSYPYSLRRRISGGKGHLSNAEALELFRSWRPHYMSHLLLSHLSRDNNDPQLVRDLFLAENSEVDIVIASRDEPTAVYCITADASVPVTKEPLMQNIHGQLSLF